MAITEHASAPPFATTSDEVNGAKSVTTASFSPPADSLVLVMVSVVYDTGTITVSSSPSTTWTKLVGNLSDTDWGSTSIYCHYFSSAPGSMTVTANTTSGSGIAAGVKVLMGADSDQSGGGTNNSSPDGTSNLQGSVTTTQADSSIYGVLSLVNSSPVHTISPVSNWTTIDNATGTVGGFGTRFATGSRSGLITPTSYTVGWNASGTINGSVSYAEIQASPGPSAATETGTLTDSALVKRTIFASDGVTAVDSSPIPSGYLLGTEVGSGTDTAVARVTWAVGDSASGVDNGSVATAFVGKPASDTATFTESGKQVYPGTDTVGSVDAATQTATTQADEPVPVADAATLFIVSSALPLGRVAKVMREERYIKIEAEK